MPNKNMTKDDLIRLDDYGHKALEGLTEVQLDEYVTLLESRRQEVLKRIQELRKGR